MLKKLYNKIPYALLLIHLITTLVFCLYVSCITTTLGGDTLEHMHSSYLVHLNSIPYKDFFQHHNPLLWYIFAPILGLFDKGLSDNFITSFVTSSAIIISFINYYYLYLISKRFLTNSLGGLIASSIAITPYMVLSIIHFRPDNFMLTAFFIGLYHYFCYIEEKKLKDLSISFVLFWCSFMFLQKIIFTLVILGFITLCLSYKKKIILTDVLYALLLPLVLSLGFILYLNHHGILKIWYLSNFTFNLHIPELFDTRKIGTFWLELKIILLLATCSLFYLKKSNIYHKILSIIFVLEFLQRAFYFSAFAYYFCLLVYIASILGASFFANVILKRFYFMVYVLCFSLFFVMYNPSIYEGNIGSKKERFYTPLHRQILHHITKCDYVLNGDGTVYNIYNRDPHYYWNLLGQTDVIGAKVGIAPLMDINHVIKTKKPRIISTTPYKDKYALERGIDIIIHKPNMDYITKYYKPYKNSQDLYILKPEFSEPYCK